MQAIRTRYHSVSNTRGSYMSAKCEAGSIRMSYQHGIGTDGNHEAAMKILRKQMNWDTSEHSKMHSGSFGNDCYWIFLPCGEGV